jgi:GT2 family glycosyltransferase
MKVKKEVSTENKIELSIITINYNSADFILKLWNSLEKFVDNSFELIIVDNNSSVQNLKKLDKISQEKNVHLIKLQNNIGFGAGNNEGVKFAQGKFIAIVNPDIELIDNPFPNLLKALKSDKKNGIAVPQLFSPNGVPQENIRKFPTIFSLLSRRIFSQEKSFKPFRKNKSIDWGQGSFLLTSYENFIKVGGFDDFYFLFLEDTDLCRTYWENNLRVVAVPSSKAHHQSERLSGGHFWVACWKKTFWIHLWSAVKYFWKWRGKKLPIVK